jgi:hypothetical protein
LPSCRLSLEALEVRTVPYALTGNAWPHPELITLSFMPDGTVLAGSASGPITSNLFQKFNAKFGSPATWQNQVLKAAQQFAAQTNINFAVKPDDGSNAGSGTYQQGDPGKGDIRIGGYNFGTPALASAYLPPPANNYSIAGDVTYNSNQTFNIGTTYDLFTVSMHEIGHALGLGHSTAAGAVMGAAYPGTKTGLSADDIAGIRAVYSAGLPRSADTYDTGTGNNSFATATDLSALVHPISLTGLLTGLDLTTTSDKDFYRVTVPSGTTGTMVVKVQSSGLSLLAPKLTVYAADQVTVKGTASGLNQFGTTLTVTVTGVTAGQTYYLKVEGADASVMGTGAYALTLNFGNNPSPLVPLPSTTTAEGSPRQNGGGLATTGTNDDHGHDGEPLPSPSTTDLIILDADDAPAAASAAPAAPTATPPTAPAPLLPRTVIEAPVNLGPATTRLASGRTGAPVAAPAATPPRERLPVPVESAPERPEAQRARRPRLPEEVRTIIRSCDDSFADEDNPPLDRPFSAAQIARHDTPWSRQLGEAVAVLLFGNAYLRMEQRSKRGEPAVPRARPNRDSE